MENLNDLAAFTAVAEERSFTKAAARLGVSPSALSQTIRNLESRLGVRLLTRTTRSVATTDAGQRLFHTLAPRFAEISEELSALNDLRDKPAGTIRITAGEHAAVSVVKPMLAGFIREYPDIQVEVITDYGLTDIVKDGYDAGIRMGEQVAKDMIAVKVGPDLQMAAVASPGYFTEFSTPQTPQDLAQHRCINVRLPTYGGLFPWYFEKNNREVNVRVNGPLVFNSLDMRLSAALEGLGIAYMPLDHAQPYLESGALVRVLEDWSPPFPGYHLYYPDRRYVSPAFRLFIDALKFRD